MIFKDTFNKRALYKLSLVSEAVVCAFKKMERPTTLASVQEGGVKRSWDLGKRPGCQQYFGVLALPPPALTTLWLPTADSPVLIIINPQFYPRWLSSLSPSRALIPSWLPKLLSSLDVPGFLPVVNKF